MKKHTFYAEWAYVTAIVLLALGASFMAVADLGLSMVVAPAYLVHLKLAETWRFVTFGVAEYLVQAVLLSAMILVLREFHRYFLFSFVTALFYGRVLDTFLALWGGTVPVSLAVRIALFAGGTVLCALGVSFVFHTYLSPEVYELFIKELSAKYHRPTSRIKTLYDYTSCAVAIVLSFLFYGFLHFEGVKWGTIVCALVTGRCVGWFNRLLDRHFSFPAALPCLQRHFLPPQESDVSPS